jgi:hypothetical protein
LAQLLAIDWDQDQFHIVSGTSTRKHLTVDKAVSFPLGEPLTLATAANLGRALKLFLKNSKLANNQVVFSVGRERVIFKDIRFPAVPTHEEPAVVRFQAGKEMTEPMETSIIDYAHVPQATARLDRQVVAVISKRELPLIVQKLCEEAGLKPLGVVPRSFGFGPAVLRALPAGETLAADGFHVVLAIGVKWAELCFYRGEQVVLARSLSNSPLLAGEVKRSIAVFMAQHGAEVQFQPPGQLFVFGNPASLDERFADVVGLPLRWLNPLQKDGGPALDAPLGGGFAGPVGLLELWAKQGKWPINLIAPKKGQAPTNANRRRLVVYAAAAGLVAAIALVVMYKVIDDKKREAESLALRKAENEQILKNFAQDRADIDGIKEWENTNVSWLNEIYDLSARFPQQEGFRVNQLMASVTARKGSKDPYAGRIVLNGTMVEGQSPVVGQLTDSMTHDKHVRAVAERVKGKEYHVRIDVAKQPGDSYATKLIPPPARPVPPPAPVIEEDPVTEDPKPDMEKKEKTEESKGDMR